MERIELPVGPFGVLQIYSLAQPVPTATTCTWCDYRELNPNILIHSQALCH